MQIEVKREGAVERKIIRVRGAVDLHCHSAPDLFPRLADDRETIVAARDAGVRAMLLKCHHESTVSRAYLLDQEMKGEIRVFGGIVLNRYVGGINPGAVEAALRTGAKEVWMPTIDAEQHGKVYGKLGAYGTVQAGGRETGKGITVLEGGKLTDAILEVIELVAQYDVILGTCHLSPMEIAMLVKEARARKVQRVLITHPYWIVPKLTLDDLKGLVKLGAKAEFGYCTVSPMWNYATVEQIKEAIKAIGADNCVIMSDAGQRHNPISHEALRIFAQCLYEKGLTDGELMKLMVDNPRALLGI
ncbi:MAG: hypothetical protein HYV08_08595 [Deltaproteobacteria bacterium]|nr:hypothetical protein [Deltaproteobacteria bacterium]MBI3075608.1 hypothetical protein [Deltaproteobacteria bacterium]